MGITKMALGGKIKKVARGIPPVKMSDVIEILKNKVYEAEKAKRMFFLPLLPSCLKVTNTEVGTGSTMGDDYLIQFPNGDEITVESKSRDGSRTFMMRPDRSHVYIKAYSVIDGKKTEVDSFTYGWDEKV